MKSFTYLTVRSDLRTWSNILTGRLLCMIALAILSCSAAAAQTVCEGVPNEVLLDLRNQSDLATVANQFGLETSPIDQVGTPPTYRMRLRGNNKQSSCQVAAALSADPRVARAETNAKLSAVEQPGLPWTTGHSWAIGVSWAIGGSVKGYQRQYFPGLIRLSQAQTVTKGTRTDNGQPVVVAVLDTGIDPSHPAFAGRLVPGYDFVSNDADPSEEGILRQNPVYGHGTHVAGIVAMVAPEAKIMPVRVLDTDGSGELWRVTAAIIWAANHGADVINISFGYNSSPDLLKDLLDNCDGTPPEGTKTFPEMLRQVAVIAGAGNGGNSSPIFPAGNRIDAQLGVGATTRYDHLWEFSTMSVGTSGSDRFIRAVAPGENIISSIPGGRYAMWSGTSMAAPIAAGVAALVRAKFPALTPNQIVSQIAETGISWDCTHPTRGEIKTNRVDAYCAVTNDRSCGINAHACDQ
jgi:subtilisin family serine protease